MIDTHSHLYDEPFKGEEDAAIERALAAGVSSVVLPDINSASRQSMFSLAGRHPGVAYPCLGLHPTEIGDNLHKELSALEDSKGRKVYAIGETGLDFHWTKDNEKEQREAFEYQIELAHSLNLPLILHSREATGATLEVIRGHRHSDLRGVFHAYSGSLETVREVMRLGDWYFGIGGVLTFKKASIALVAKDIPLERIVLETDSPYLAPTPHRGERNESAYIPIIAARLAEIKGISIEEVDEVTTANAKKLFSI